VKMGEDTLEEMRSRESIDSESIKADHKYGNDTQDMKVNTKITSRFCNSKKV
jgi:hypothetical protein